MFNVRVDVYLLLSLLDIHVLQIIYTRMLQ